VVLVVLNLVHDLREVVAGRCLHRRERLERLEPVKPQSLPNWQQVPVVGVGSTWSGQCAPYALRRLLVKADRLFKRVALDVLHGGPMELYERQQPAGGPGLGDVVVHLPVFVAHRCGRRTREVVEDFPRRLVGLSRQVVDLIDAIERGLDDARVLARLDLFLEAVALRTTSGLHQRWQPVEGGE